MAILNNQIILVISTILCFLNLPQTECVGKALHELIADFKRLNPADVEPLQTQASQQIQTYYDSSPALGSSNNNGAFDPRFDARISNLLGTSVLELAHDIGKTVLTDTSSKSDVFSPLSIYGALSLLLLGSSGQTFTELLQAMRLSQDSYLASNPWKIHEEFGLLIDDITRQSLNPQHPRIQSNWKLNTVPSTYGAGSEADHKISIANGLFVQNGYSIRPDYQSAVLGTYRSHLANLDFTSDAARSTKYINDWVSHQTAGKIPEILSDTLTDDTKIIMASALYFNAMWEKTFSEGITGLKPFYPDGENQPSITVEMMGQGGVLPYYDAKEYDCRIIGLPYKHKLTTMYIILPNNSTRQRLREMQAYLTADKIEDMISKMELKTAIILLPKMHISNKVDLKHVLQKLGVDSLFDPRKSDLSLVSHGYEVINAAPVSVQQPQNVASHPIGYDSANRFNPASGYSSFRDEGEDDKFIFSRSGTDDEEEASNDTANDTTTVPPPKTANRRKRNVSYKVASQIRKKDQPLRLKDYIISKRITKSNPDKKHLRARRQALDQSQSLKNLDQLRSYAADVNPGLYASEIVHKIDLTVNEKGTEGGAATVTTLYRTGTDAVVRVETPFMFMVRHDDTKLPLFYGTVYEPTNF